MFGIKRYHFKYTIQFIEVSIINTNSLLQLRFDFNTL